MKKRRIQRGLHSWRGYWYERVTATRVRLYRPCGDFLCYLGPRDLAREIRRDKIRSRRKTMTENLPLFLEAA